ncbi:unnamed protein product [Enterobius vermicularis]|uniref:Uncharacterized protein n=1 Tax=Enterobius vermicularis TaxID=51028 RepID=A0A0N4VAE1_ENTVE|nr:unnamed protein product [Enterobius vermicularis]
MRSRQNWENYASVEGVDIEKAFAFSGGLTEEMKDEGSRISMLRFQKKTSFLPRICAGLSQRTAQQVIGRMRRLYHPSSFERVPWTEEDFKKLEELHSHKMKPAAISLLLNRKVRSVDAQLDKLKKKKVTPRSRPFAWDFYAKSRLIAHVKSVLRKKLCEDEESKDFFDQLYEETDGRTIVHFAMSSLPKNHKIFNFDNLAKLLRCTPEEVLSRW